MHKPPFVRSPYNYDTNKASDESGLDTGTEGGAKQSFKEECDINTIVKRFGLGYELPTDGIRMPTYGDFTGINNFHDAMNVVAQNAEQFELLPAELRARFDNQPGKFVDFCLDENNRPEIRKLGLLSKEAMERDDAAAAAAEDSRAATRAEKRAKDAQTAPSPKAKDDQKP